MTKEEVWAKFCEVNPQFKSEYRIEMSVDKIRKMIETAYKYGNEAGYEQGKWVSDSLNRVANGKMDAFKEGAGNDLFNQIFGNKK